MSHLFFILFISLFSASLQAEDDNLSSVYGETITIASGYEQLIKESPTTVAVITEEDIKNIGAITLEEVLETVAGIHVSYVNGFLPTYVIRGVASPLNASVLINLDGIPINDSVASTSYFSLNHLTKNIERIEIIKGPSSAIYGADAFSGVINIITKNKNITEAGVFGGSFDTFGGWMNHGYEHNDLKLSFSAQGVNTNGSNRTVNSDRQTIIDNFFNTNASLAPGSINRGREEIDIKIAAEYSNSRIYLRYIHNDAQNGTGTSSLDNEGFVKSDAWITGFDYKFGSDEWKTKLSVNYTGYVYSSHSNTFPAGTFGGLFNSPVINDISYTEHDLSTNLSTVYKGVDKHIIHAGIGFEYDVANDINDERNYLIGSDNLLFPVGSVQNTDSLGIKAFVDPKQRYIAYGFIQDEWSFLKDFTLTAGLRLDYFSDFGFTFNPRSTLIWNISQFTITKLVYGRAFRSPAFFELYTNKSSLLVTGNRNLEPETIQTVEWSIQKNWFYNINTQLSLFWHETKDIITDSTITNRLDLSESRAFKNSSGANTYGIELEFNYKINNDLEFDLNYSYISLNPKNDREDVFTISVPRQKIYAAINWEFIPRWSINLRSTSVIGRDRSISDKRSPIDDYTKLDFTLRGKKVIGGLDITFKINNLLNADIRDPSIDELSIPNDYPLEDRAFVGIISYRF